MKTLLFANTDWFLYNFQLPLARAIRARGDDVVLLSPPGIYSRKLIEEGFRWIPFPLSRRGLNPFSELLTLLRIVKLYRREKPDLAHHFTTKCVVYGSIAARITGVTRIVNSIPGLGSVFTDGNWQMRLIRPMVRRLYRLALPGTSVIFLNRDDRRVFIEQQMIRGDDHHLILGAGVDLSRFQRARENRESDAQARDDRRRSGKSVLLAARLLRSKGVREFVEAARLVHETLPDVVFLVAGEADPGSPDTLSARELQELGAGGHAQFLGHRADIDALLGSSTIAVLPSNYREGIPQFLIEAAASGLPLVATDMPGCREIVRHAVNGLLIPERNPGALAEAIKTLLQDDKLCAAMGANSRQIASEEFSQEMVIEKTLVVYRFRAEPERRIGGSKPPLP